MNKVIAGIATTGFVGLSLIASAPANAAAVGGKPALGEPVSTPAGVVCTTTVLELAVPGSPAVEAVPPTEEVFHYEKGALISPAVEAVPAQWWVWSPNKGQEPFDGPPAFPSDGRGTWQGPKTAGGPDGEGTFNASNGNSGNGSWFHRTPAVEAKEAVYGPDVKVIDKPATPGTPAKPAVPAKDAVTREDCTAPSLVLDDEVTTSYQCDADFPTQTSNTSVTRIDYTYDPAGKAWFGASTTETEEPTVRFLTEEEVLEHCAPTPGDLPVDSGTPGAPVSNPTSPSAPAAAGSASSGTPTLTAEVSTGVVAGVTTEAQPATQAQVAGQAEQTTQTEQLAYTGIGDKLLAAGGVAVAAILAGLGLTRFRRNAA